MLTFVCDQCGAIGGVSAPGSARCTACGYVAFIEAPAGWRGTPEPDPFAAPSPDRERAARDLGGGVVARKERRATLWVRPGPPIPDHSPIAVTLRARSLHRKAIAGAVLAGGGALALAAAVTMGPRWLDRGAEISGGALPPAPVQRLAPPSVPPAQEQGASARSGKAARAVPAKRALATAASQAARPSDALVNPAPEDRRCVPRALRARRDLAGRLPGEIAVRLRVAANGDVGRIEVLGVADRELADAIGDAVRSCRFSPGTDEEGRSVALPIVMRIRFASPEATAGF